MSKQITLQDLAGHPQNPRKITDKKLQMLKDSLAEFGDLSGFVYNVRTKRLCGGHQRKRALPHDAQIVIKQEFDPPTSRGTVAVGHVFHDGEQFAYRAVNWDEKKEKAANIAANKHGGDFDLPLLKDWILELDQDNFNLDLTGFEKDELEKLFTWDEPEPEKGPGAPKEKECPECGHKF